MCGIEYDSYIKYYDNMVCKREREMSSVCGMEHGILNQLEVSRRRAV